MSRRMCARSGITLNANVAALMLSVAAREGGGNVTVQAHAAMKI